MNSAIKNDLADISVYTDTFNKRIRIDDYSGNHKEVLALIEKNIPGWTEKLIIKSRKNDLSYFIANGFLQEAFIKEYFNGADMYFLVKYFSTERAYDSKHSGEQHIVQKVLSGESLSLETDLQMVSVAKLENAVELAQLYSSIFEVYPTPLGNPDYLRKTMEEGTQYVVIREQNKIISAASAEINRQYYNAELTDCATLPEAQGKGHMKKLLSKLEDILVKDKIHCLYTIARAESYSMNKVFHQLNFTYSGRLINNCFIYSGLENMNVWYKLV